MNKSTYGLLFIFFLPVLACSSTPGSFPSQFEPQPVSLETFQLEKLEVYIQDQPIFVDIDELLLTIDDPQIFESWNEMLGNCQTHRPNHPRYTDHYLVKTYHKDGHLFYELSVESDDEDGIDMSPLKTERDLDFSSTTYELGLYRCEGLREIVNEITAK